MNALIVNVSGAGLGFYVALKMAEQMGGTITCESEGDGRGSTFTFELPLGGVALQIKFFLYYIFG